MIKCLCTGLRGSSYAYVILPKAAGAKYDNRERKHKMGYRKRVMMSIQLTLPPDEAPDESPISLLHSITFCAPNALVKMSAGVFAVEMC